MQRPGDDTSHGIRPARILTLLGALALVAAACGDDSASTTEAAAATTAAPETTTTQAAVTTAAPTTAPAATDAGAGGGLQIVEVGFDTDSQGGWVLLQNTGSGPVSLGGFFLCQRPSYFGLPDVELQPGEVYWVATDGFESLNVEPGVGADGGFGRLSPGSGEMGLYTSQAFGDPASIISYVEWGSGGHGRSSVAVESGIWGDGDFVDVPGETTGAIGVIDGAATQGAASWEAIEAP